MWVKIKKDHDHWPSPRRMVSFKGGTEVSVTSKIGEDLIAKGVAEEIPTPTSAEAKIAKETGHLPTKEAKSK